MPAGNMLKDSRAMEISLSIAENRKPGGRKPGNPQGESRESGTIGLPPDRLDRSRRLLGDDAMARLARARVLVVGVGGVGSVAAECLARTGVGHLVLADPDRVSPTDINRQLQATEAALGRPKAEAMAERLKAIAPGLDAKAVVAAYSPDAPDALLDPAPDFVVDAFDSLTAKCHLLATCRERGIPVVTATGSAGRIDPSCIRTDDLSKTDVDPLAKMVRKLLRRRHGFPRKGKFGILAVYSVEDPNGPDAPGAIPSAPSEPRGSVGFVTGIFGLHCAAAVIRALGAMREKSSTATIQP